MWPLPTLSNELLSISLNDTNLACSWIQSTKKNTPCTLKAYTSFSLTNLEHENAVIYNPTYIKQCLTEFIQKHQLHNAYSVMSISGKNVIEAITLLPIASPQPADFIFPKLRNLLWDYRYLYPNNNDQFAFYICGITQPLLLQYQLIATALPLNLLVITTKRMALFNLYNHHYKATFRHTQLAHDMMHHNNEIHHLFSIETIRRNLSINPSFGIDLEQEKNSLLTALGLFFTGKDMHATY